MFCGIGIIPHNILIFIPNVENFGNSSWNIANPTKYSYAYEYCYDPTSCLLVTTLARGSQVVHPITLQSCFAGKYGPRVTLHLHVYLCICLIYN